MVDEFDKLETDYDLGYLNKYFELSFSQETNFN